MNVSAAFVKLEYSSDINFLNSTLGYLLKSFVICGMLRE
ncbi:hypothetical protein PC129_g9745 [Phytophthora cactorum]|uniref:Uncharacterized protein n=1 Tax=Phytophthora cactorum TaxID=29920 RepID=A0A329SQR7_9STRA|nr:hypothetical protein Pcac1_g14838 [Phytophthora cactorum]KAG2807678.1 hypothetical protein PC112_g17299 [Phytophthora cactorum]KAG2819972.1 hypothetical protein PC111_g11672 [Phytophthora cactorum]KAG2859784.1 hypothetical protein PC113_g8631 [Phytophthora cactorum]KAG2887199.1 hypothetical protein PC114_g18905 [Phytophthora cactorum]